MNKKLNIIFDFDGVVINSHLTKTLAFHDVFKVYGKNIALKAKKFHLNNIGRSRYFKFKFIFKNILRLKLTKKKIKILDEKFDFFLQKKIKKMTPSKSLINFFRKKNQVWNLYISTGTPRAKIIKILKKKKLFEYFKKVYGSPSSKINHIKKIIKNNQKSIFIGDSLEDYRAAKQAKIKFILKINSENKNFRKTISVNTINSFNFLEKKIIQII
jgi:beta-phosphoglucomutase-like phosphatase (HAD superfamily)